MARAISQSQFLVTISGFGKAIYFSETSGGEVTTSSSSYNDGITRKNRKIRGTTEVSDLTLTRSYDPEIDPEFIRYLSDYCSNAEGDLVITVQPIEACTEANPLGSPFVFTGCQSIGYSMPEVNRSGDGAAMIKYSFAVDDLTI
jgi:hypothetical protein